jgi:toxin ParE1/3/4
MTLKWTRQALQDLRYLYDYIADDNPTAARRMVARIREAADHLRRNPYMGRPGRVPETRELAIVGTPYIVMYRIDGMQVQIVAVIHGARRWPEHFEG